MAYFKSYNQVGQVAVSSGTTGGATVDLPNSGVSVLTGTSAEHYALQAPVAGVRKTLIWHTYSTAGAQPQLTLCATGAGTVTLLGPTTNLTTIIMNPVRSTAFASVVELVGINTTRWAVTNTWPPVLVTTATTVTGGVITATST